VKSRKKLMALSLATVALSVGAAGAASAAAIYTTHGSALGYTNSARSYVYSHNISNSGGFVSTGYRTTGGTESSLVNYSGVGTTVNKSVGSVSMIRACYSRPALPMSCGSWSG
jgi:predicted porin